MNTQIAAIHFSHEYDGTWSYVFQHKSPGRWSVTLVNGFAAKGFKSFDEAAQNASSTKLILERQQILG